MIGWMVHKAVGYLKIRYWGIKLERDIPPEFVITYHAERRAAERLPVRPNDLHGMTIRAWYQGEEPPGSFQPKNEANSIRFRTIRYRYYAKVVWVFGVRYNKQAGYAQKHLVTILPLRK